jgi:hypothetical protein
MNRWGETDWILDWFSQSGRHHAGGVTVRHLHDIAGGVALKGCHTLNQYPNLHQFTP